MLVSAGDFDDNRMRRRRLKQASPICQSRSCYTEESGHDGFPIVLDSEITCPPAGAQMGFKWGSPGGGESCATAIGHLQEGYSYL